MLVVKFFEWVLQNPFGFGRNYFPRKMDVLEQAEVEISRIWFIVFHLRVASSYNFMT